MDKVREALEAVLQGIEREYPNVVGKDDDYVYDYLGSALSAAYFKARAALASLDASPAQAEGGWRPIETAPKDGFTYVDLWFPSTGRETNWRWYRKNKFWGSGDERFERIQTLDEEPTHWQPLPPPPAASIRSGREG